MPCYLRGINGTLELSNDELTDNNTEACMDIIKSDILDFRIRAYLDWQKEKEDLIKDYRLDQPEPKVYIQLKLF